MSVKECFFLEGTPATVGLTSSTSERNKRDGVLVRRLKKAGANIVGKTNVPQLMLWHESDNPVYGRTDNPWNAERTCGGSSGGEAAVIAANGVPIGLGNDLGGSIRIPASHCGICGLKPTSHRLTTSGAFRNLRGLAGMVTQPGPFARNVNDLEIALRVLEGRAGELNELSSLGDESPVAWSARAAIDVTKLRVGYWDDDGCFPVSACVKRAVAKAVQALESRGVEVVPFEPREFNEFFDLYFGLVSVDGGRDFKQLEPCTNNGA